MDLRGRAPRGKGSSRITERYEPICDLFCALAMHMPGAGAHSRDGIAPLNGLCCKFSALHYEVRISEQCP